MIDKLILIKRLSIIKLLYRIAWKQSFEHESISVFSILSFHDCIEMFLKLSAEHKGVKSDKLNFMDYWTEIPELTIGESMRALNARRVNLKHKGLIPAKIEIETSRINTKDFLEQNTKTIFLLEFSEVSLFEMIKFDNTRKLLIQAQKYLDNQQFKESTLQSTLAFDALLTEYKKDKTSRLFLEPFNQKLERYTDRYSTDGLMVRNAVKSSIQIMQARFNKMEKAMEIIALGLDYRKFIKFKHITPEVYHLSDNSFKFLREDELHYDAQGAMFLIDFVLDSALHLQEFEFNLNK
jgi:hypothetical protein